MYRRVADDPHGEFHFELGRGLTERLGYPADDLDRIPADSIKSFAGVGYYFHLADLKDGENVLDLGSGSGTDTFIAARKVGPEGTARGVAGRTSASASLMRAVLATSMPLASNIGTRNSR
ncbi:MAG: hypothetical protein IIC55_04360 [Proteobacteria bacterium]|nr:hypothetical protein [Pseudomonadota bacterium]